MIGCGGDEPVATRGSGRAKKKKKKKKKGAKAGPSVDLSGVPKRLRAVDWKVRDAKAAGKTKADYAEARDPFQPLIEDLLESKGEDPTDDPSLAGADGGKLPVDPNQLKLVAIITGTAVHKAMMVDPTDMGHVIRAGVIIGKPKHRVQRITRNEVILRALEPDAEGGYSTISKFLLTQAELEELLP